MSVGRRNEALGLHVRRVRGPQVSEETLSPLHTPPHLGSVLSPAPGVPPGGRAPSSEVQVCGDPLTPVSVISVPTPGSVFLSCSSSEVMYRLVISLPLESNLCSNTFCLSCLLLYPNFLE